MYTQSRMLPLLENIRRIRWNRRAGKRENEKITAVATVRRSKEVKQLNALLQIGDLLKMRERTGRSRNLSTASAAVEARSFF